MSQPKDSAMEMHHSKSKGRNNSAPRKKKKSITPFYLDSNDQECASIADTTDWIREHLRKRECKQFVQDTDLKTDIQSRRKCSREEHALEDVLLLTSKYRHKKQNAKSKKAPNTVTNLDISTALNPITKAAACQIGSGHDESDNIDQSCGDLNTQNLTCLCGKSLKDHSENAQNNKDSSETTWTTETHTEGLPTDTFGEVDFVRYGQKISKYVRVDHKSKMDDIVHLLKNLWGLPAPNLLISVTGGAKAFTMAPGLKEVFRRGLTKAAGTTGAWIITSGTSDGVMKHVGEAVQDYTEAHGYKNKLVVLGVTPWGVLHNKEDLINSSGEGHWPVEYNSVLPPDTDLTSLDPNHSHFILVDDGTENIYGSEINFRVQLESSIAGEKEKEKTNTASFKDTIPIVTLVLEGGPGTLKTVKEAVALHIPAVIVQGSGRAADILAYAYEISETYHPSSTNQAKQQTSDSEEHQVPSFDEEFHKKIKQKIALEWNTTQKLDEIAQTVAQILAKKEYITIFKLGGHQEANEIDLAILNAILKGKNRNLVDQLNLAQAWNRIDIAKQEIFRRMRKWKPGELDDIMYIVIMKNRPEFVKLLIENGVSLRDFLTVPRLLSLYNKIPENCLLYKLLNKKRDKSPYKHFSLRDVGQILYELSEKVYTSAYLKKQYVNLDVDKILRDSEAEDEDNVDARDLPRCDDPTQDLFIWSVLMQRQELAVLFWHEGKDHLGTALLAQNILKSMKRRSDDVEIQKDISNQMEYFANLSVELLTECYASNEQNARLMLFRKLTNFSHNTTVTSLAVKADNKDLIGHAACQTMLKSIWMGWLHPENKTVLLLLSAIFPPLIFALKFRDDRTTIISEMERMTRRPMYGASLSVRNTERSTRKQDNHQQPKNVQCFAKCCNKIRMYYTTPIIKFILHVIFYLAFLIFYSIVLINDFSPKICVQKYVLAAWAGTIISEEIRQVRNKSSTFCDYIKKSWNILDLVTFVTFFVAVILGIYRGVQSCAACAVPYRIILTINLMAFYFRILHICSVHKELGPKLVMIGKMIKDLAYFMIIMAVFMISYGIAIQHLLYPSNRFTWEVLKLLLTRSFFQINGEFMLEESLGDNSTCMTIDDVTACPSEHVVSPILLAVYVLVMNVLMVNLLIAMFSNTYAKIQQNADLVYKKQRYFLIKEFYTRLPLPPPLIIFNHLFLIIRECVRRCCNKCKKRDSWFSISMEPGEERQMILWESVNVDECMRKRDTIKRTSMEQRVQMTNNDVKKIATSVQELSVQMNAMERATKKLTGSPPIDLVEVAKLARKEKEKLVPDQQSAHL